MNLRDEICRITAFMAFVLLLSAVQVQAAPGDILAQFPAPGPGSRDLAWDGEHLWVMDDATNTVYKLDPASGTVLSRTSSMNDNPAGLAWDGQTLWVSDKTEEAIRRLDMARNMVSSIIDIPLKQVKPQYKHLVSIEGLDWEDGYLWVGRIEGWSSRICQIDPSDGRIVREIYSRGYPIAVEVDSKHIWTATDNKGVSKGLIYKCDRETGIEITSFRTPGDYPVGIALDGDAIWCVDSETDYIYKLSTE